MQRANAAPLQRAEMEFVDIYATSLRVSRVALGTWAMGGWMWGGADMNESVATVRAALDHGINLIDTAPAYGFGLAEEIVGCALSAAGTRSNAVIATKTGIEWHDDKVYRLPASRHLHRQRQGRALRGAAARIAQKAGRGSHDQRVRERTAHPTAARRVLEFSVARSRGTGTLARRGERLAAADQQLRALLRVVCARRAAQLSGGSLVRAAGSPAARSAQQNALRFAPSQITVSIAGRIHDLSSNGALSRRLLCQARRIRICRGPLKRRSRQWDNSVGSPRGDDHLLVGEMHRRTHSRNAVLLALRHCEELVSVSADAGDLILVGTAVSSPSRIQL